MPGTVSFSEFPAFFSRRADAGYRKDLLQRIDFIYFTYEESDFIMGEQNDTNDTGGIHYGEIKYTMSI